MKYIFANFVLLGWNCSGDKNATTIDKTLTIRSKEQIFNDSVANSNPTTPPPTTNINKTQTENLNVVNFASKSAYFTNAAIEIHKMLKGEQEKSFKRAVFLVENARQEGKLSWEEYAGVIQEGVDKMQQLLKSKGARGHKDVALHWAIFSYMMDSLAENHYTPCKYDTEGLLVKDPASHYVSHLLKHRKGNCHSMPFLYQIFAEELGAKSHIARAPLHYYIKHQDEKGKWWNLELTGASYSRTSFIVEEFKVTDLSIRKGLYMKPLNETEMLVLCIEDLCFNYMRNYGTYEDGFMEQIINMGLKYSPISDLEWWRGACYVALYNAKCKELGFPEERTQLSAHPSLAKIAKKIHHSDSLLVEYGFVELSLEEYQKAAKKCYVQSKNRKK